LEGFIVKRFHLSVVILAGFWTCALAAESYLVFRDIYQWHAELSTLDKNTDANLKDAQLILQSTLAIKAQASEESFLQSLVNVLPQEKRFIRTQKAVSDEVGVLRYKVARRLHNDLHVLVDIRANKLYVKRGVKLLWEADCSVGRGGMLFDRETGRRWEFVTPRGQFEVLNKMESPLWIKPDWAFVEEHKPVPPPDDPSRQVQGELGAYVLNLGDGYLIHGTKDESVLGHPVSHGCVRLGAVDLKRLFEIIPRGARVFIY
jgi:L,D-transpeptidase ErfK/SrfK